MCISVLHIGLPLEHPSISPEERPKVTQRLANLRATMTQAGYAYEVFHASPETGLDAFRHRLKTRACDAVLLGGGIQSDDPAMTFFIEQIINTTHETAPQAKIMLFHHAVPVRETVERWFPPARP